MKNNLTFYLTLLLTLVLQTTFAQQKVITGVVTEAGTGEPIPGVNVIVKGTEKGAATDFDGKYVIKAKQGDILEFSYLGYKTTTRKVGSSNTINVEMASDKNELETVVINALGVEVKKASEKGITVSNIKAKVLQTTGESDPVAALAGKVSGVNINLASGDPGASTNITIRGPKSILLSNKPLFVVDGMPIIDDIYGSGVAGVERPSKIADIDPNNIESIKVIKGGAAAAIWGSKGANGVVVITTKKGKIKNGKIDIKITSSYGFDNPLSRFPLQEKFGQGIEGHYVDLGENHKQSGSWGDKISDRPGTPDIVEPDLYFVDQEGKKWHYILTKNEKETFNDKNYNAVISQGSTLRNTFQVSTGTDKSKYILSINHLDQKGIFKNSFFKKIGIYFNNNFKPTKKLSINTNLQFTNTKQNAIQKGSNLSGLLLGLYRTPADFDNSGYIGERHEYGVIYPYSQRTYRQPVGTVYKGRFNNGAGYNNPLFTVNEQKNPYYSNHVLGGLNIGYSVYDWLKLTAKTGVDYASENAGEYFPVNSGEEALGSYSNYIYSFFRINADFIAQIDKKISNNFHLNGLFGINWIHDESDYVYNYYYDFLLPSDIPNSANATDEKNVGGLGTSIKRKNSVYTTTTLSYKDLFYTTITGRAEVSSTYSGFITYPSITLAFDVANLEYFKKKDNYFLNQLTLRTALSKVGNDPGNYWRDTYYFGANGSDGYGSYWSASNYGGAIWRRSLKGNDNIQPEITTEIEFGADVKMFNNRFSLNLAYYDSKSTDLILFQKVPPSIGYSYKWNNIAEMTNKGYEIEASYKILQKDNGLNWTIGGTYSHNKNLITKIVGSEYIGLDGFISTSSGVAVGHSFGVLRSGDFERDDSGNLVLDDNGFPKKGKVDFVGDPNPDFKASAYTNFNYKNFKLRILVDGSFGGQSWYGTYGALTFFGRTLETANEVTVSGADAANIVNYDGISINNLPNSVLNDDGSYTVRGNLKDFGNGYVLLDEKWYTRLGGGFGPVGTQFFKDATWIKLREVSMGYTLKADILKKARIKSIYFGITGRNLYLWTKDKGWYIDPESNLSGSSKGRGLQYFNHPTTKSFIFTTTIKF